MRVSGKIWKDYLASWPNGQWYEDSNETYNGRAPTVADPTDTDIVEFSEGIVFKNSDDREGTDLVRHFRKWERSLSETTLIVTVPNDRLYEIKNLIKSVKGKIIK